MNLFDEVIGQLADDLDPYKDTPDFSSYRYDPVSYIRDFLGWEPWSGGNRIGQKEIVDEIGLSLAQQEEKREYDKNPNIHLNYYKPGEYIPQWYRIEAGHSVGKTKLASGLVNFFFDCFPPSLAYCFAPTYPQINDLLFKEIRKDRRRNIKLPGTVLEEPVLKMGPESPDHFAKGKATGSGKTENIQGQHGPYMMFILDEAEGLQSYVWDVVRTMLSSVSVVIALANPRTRSSIFYKSKNSQDFKSFRLSCLNHPNVVEGKEIIPGSVTRAWVEGMMFTANEGRGLVQETEEHDIDAYTFDWYDGKIYKPSNEFLWRVMGVPPLDSSLNTFCPGGRYEEALKRAEATQVGDEEGSDTVYIGVDAARFGDDQGTVYYRRNNVVSLWERISKEDGYAYYMAVKLLLEELLEDGVENAYIRVDGGGGYGSTCIDNLNHDIELQDKFVEFAVKEVLFNSLPGDTENYYDTVTELYEYAGKAMNFVALHDVPDLLMSDICERTYDYKRRGKWDVKTLTPKKLFRKIHGRSPDDGDGFVLCVASNDVIGVGVDLGFA